VRLLKHVVRCYLRLSDNMRCATHPLEDHPIAVLTLPHRAREALRACLPEPLRDQTFSVLLKVRLRFLFHEGFFLTSAVRETWSLSGV
jgi:CCR4-NOT transcription complex subunit 9